MPDLSNRSHDALHHSLPPIPVLRLRWALFLATFLATSMASKASAAPTDASRLTHRALYATTWFSFASAGMPAEDEQLGFAFFRKWGALHHYTQAQKRRAFSARGRFALTFIVTGHLRNERATEGTRSRRVSDGTRRALNDTYVAAEERLPYLEQDVADRQRAAALICQVADEQLTAATRGSDDVQKILGSIGTIAYGGGCVEAIRNVNLARAERDATRQILVTQDRWMLEEQSHVESSTVACTSRYVRISVRTVAVDLQRVGGPGSETMQSHFAGDALARGIVADLGEEVAARSDDDCDDRHLASWDALDADAIADAASSLSARAKVLDLLALVPN